MKSIINILTVIGLVVFFSSCSDDDDSSSAAPPPGGGQQGSASFTVSGGVEGEYSGTAEFMALETTIGTHIWGIYLFDQNPLTFNIDFQLFDQSEAIELPGTGTYPLGLGWSNELFLGSCEFFEDGSFIPLENYNIGAGGGTGELVITTSTDELVEGTFSFTAVALDDLANVVDSVVVSNGVFSAVPEQ